tara:strand:- start:308 stop:559 length:252 start_codon:yes stop_codon:yes gene_type:complete
MDNKLLKIVNKRLTVLSPVNEAPGTPKKPDTPKRKQIKRMLERKRTSNKLESPVIRAIESTIVKKHDSDTDDDGFESLFNLNN